MIKTITLNTAKMPEMVEFFGALGIPMKAMPVNKGTVAYRGNFSEVEICLLSIPKKDRLATPDLSFRLQIENISDVMARLRKLPQVQILMELQELPFGKMAVVLDPEGHSIELTDA